MTGKIKPQDVIIIHAVFEDHSAILDMHTHGLNKYDHPEFQVFAPSIFRVSACGLLNSLADAVINDKEVFKDMENCDWGDWDRFTLSEIEKGILSIIPVLPSCDCCGNEKENKN